MGEAGTPETGIQPWKAAVLVTSTLNDFSCSTLQTFLSQPLSL